MSKFKPYLIIMALALIAVAVAARTAIGKKVVFNQA
jgi:hypothetical protein